MFERCLENADLFLQLTIDRHLRLAALVDRQKQQSLLERDAPFCLVEIDGQECVPTFAEPSEPDSLLIRWMAAHRSAIIDLHLTLVGPTFHWRLAAVGQDLAARVSFPFLAALRVSQDAQNVDGASSFRDGQGRIIWRNADWPLPLVRIGPDGRTLTLLSNPASPLGTDDIQRLARAQEISLQLLPERRMMVEAELVLHAGGWPAAFHLFRSRVRDLFDLSHYQRPDLAWYGDQLVQHFTFLYGREILDLESGTFELDRFLDEGEQLFGGYDGMLIWGVYPRIGFDERTQWDFYDDLPGGRPGLRAMARRARERGVRFFVPYKPWDHAANEHGQPTAHNHEYLAQLVADVEADGVFLDTMNNIDEVFRAALDRARPGVVLCPEIRVKGKAFEMITGSWDQSPMRDEVVGLGSQGNWSASEETMPGVEVWRFVFPEHRLFVVNRHAVGTDRIRLIQRGFFNGMGWVVWQDIFGLVLSYSPQEASLLKQCRTILREHREALWSSHPTPLLPTLLQGIYANEFPGAAKRLWTFYNETERAITAPVLRIEPRANCHFVNVWTNQEVMVDGAGCLHLTLAPQSVGAVVEFPRLLAYLPDQQQVTLLQPVEEASWQVACPGEEWREQTDVSLALDLKPLSSTPCSVRILAHGEVLDQIIVRPAFM